MTTAIEEGLAIVQRLKQADDMIKDAVEGLMREARADGQELLRTGAKKTCQIFVRGN